ncbi:MAG: hypothetical protein M1823_003038 [Watsoniomyces obsoletus]|nr:MAG: hypothetical protein M1823_003038 [Watsoniomyces obsoletus]
MASTREAPNPLRPYYIPPSVGLPSDPLPSAPGVKGSSSSYNSGATTRSTLSSSARGILSDLDYSDYLSNSSPSATEVVKKLVDQALWKYTSVLLAQPFEVAKTVLQCHLADEGVVNRKPPPGVDKSSILYENDVPSEEDSEGDELAYFTSNRVPYSERERNSHRRRGGGEDDYHSKNTPRPASTFASDTPPHQLELRRPDALLEVISQLWTKEGAWGVWKGSNATFVYSVLLKTIESWTRSLLAAVLNAPDPGLLPRVGVGVGVISSGVADSPQPWMSLGIAVAAAGIAGVILSPLDMIRTR